MCAYHVHIYVYKSNDISGKHYGDFSDTNFGESSQVPSRWDNPSGKIHGHSPEDQRTPYIKTIKPLGQTLGRDSLGQLFTSLINRLPTRSQAPCCIARLGHRWPLTLHLTIQCASAGEPSCPEEIVQVGAGHKPRETVAGDFVLKHLRGEAHT